MTKIISATLLGFMGLAVFSNGAEARVVPADAMTCAQAIRHYETHGRIYVIANGDDIVPIYGMKPARDFANVRCQGRNKSRKSYWVNTTDNNYCVIAVYCG